jgi:hypothetical protein
MDLNHTNKKIELIFPENDIEFETPWVKRTTAGNKTILLNPEKILRLGAVYDVNTSLKLGEETYTTNDQIFTDYLTNLTNLIKDKAEKRQKEILEDLQKYA